MERKKFSVPFPLDFIGEDGKVYQSETTVMPPEVVDLMRNIMGTDGEKPVFDTEAKKRELVTIATSVADYSYEQNISSILLLDRAARPSHLAIREAWKRKYHDVPMPSLNFVNPTGFIDIMKGLHPTDAGYPLGIEVMVESMIKGNRVGDFYETGRPLQVVRSEFREIYQRLYEKKEEPLLLFDTCIHSGTSMMPLLTTLEKEGFSDIHLGVASDVHNYSGIEPDLIALAKLPEGGCYPFNADIKVDRTFSSVTSSYTPDTPLRVVSDSLRREIGAIVKEAPDSWFGIEDK